MELKTKKRIVGFILLIALGLMLIPLLFSHSVVTSDELKLSDRVPSRPVKSAALDLSVPPEEVTVPTVKPVPVPQSTPSSRIVFEQVPAPHSTEVKSIEEEESAVLRSAPASNQPKAPTSATEEAAVPISVSKPAPAPSKAAVVSSEVPAKPAAVPSKTTLLKTTVSPKPVPAAGVLAPESWVVQMGSFSDKANAESLVTKIQAAGFPAYLISSTTSQGALIRVLVGPEILKSAADEMRGRLAGALNLNGIVVKKP